MERVGLIVINYKGEKDTCNCIDSISKSTTKNLEFKIFVVDNNSGKESVDIIKKFTKERKLQNVEILESDKNLGFSAGNNLAIRKAIEQGFDFVIIQNNDTIVEKDFLQQMVDYSKTSKNIGIVVPKIYFEPGYEYHKDRYKKEDLGKVLWYAGGLIDWNNLILKHRGVDEVDNGQFNIAQETDFATGCSMLARTELLKQIGLFDEKYFLYYEDSDLSLRVKKSGHTIVYNPKAVVWHKNAGSTGGSGSMLQDYYTTRNRLLFGFRYASLRTKLSLLRESVKLLITGRENQKKGVRDFYLMRYGHQKF